MLDSLLQQSTIPILEKVTAFAQRRQQVLAGNIANIDTDDYRMRDLPVQDFEQALKQAVQARRENSSSLPHVNQMSLSPGEYMAGMQQSLSGMTDAGSRMKNLSDFFGEDLQVARDAEFTNVKFHDGGNRSIEEESMEMVKNASMQSFAIQVMISQMKTLESVISERII